MGKRGSTLYAAFDDSNHAGKVAGEVIVGLFSILPEDSDVNFFKNRRMYQESFDFLKDYSRGLRFTLLTHDFASKSRYNLPLVAPYLIKEYLKTASLPRDLSNLSLFFDGEFNSSWGNILRQEIPEFRRIKIANYSGKTKRKSLPSLLYHADVVSNALFKEYIGTIFKSPNMVTIPPEELLRSETKYSLIQNRKR